VAPADGARAALVQRPVEIGQGEGVHGTPRP
jgi:hypothetical protein